MPPSSCPKTRVDHAMRGASAATSREPARCGRVAYLLQVFPKFSETFILNELIEHQRQGAAVRVLSLRLPREGRFHRMLADLNEAAEYLPEALSDAPGRAAEALWSATRHSPRAMSRATWGRLRGRFTTRDVWQAAMARRWAERRGVTHVHCHFGGYAARVAFLSRLMGGPSFSMTLHAFDIFRRDVDAALLREMIETSAFTVTVSRFNERFLRDVIGASALKIRVLYNGLPLERFAFHAAPRSSRTIVAVGRLIEKKGFTHLVRACAILAQRGALDRCDIIGDGREKDALKALIRELGLSGVVRLTGPQPIERVAAALTEASAFALPCVAAQDGNMDALPTVLLEAMASGCPCVSTRLSGIPEIIEDKASGLLVEPGDEAGLADALERVMTDAALARRLALAGRQRVERLFDVRNSVATLSDWLQSAAADSAANADAAASSHDGRPSRQITSVVQRAEAPGEERACEPV
ncbi:MAG: glycosyltransferase [Phycisphaerae bacterium]|nr:glycosyltransferase [Phycisphaerae bacterium]NUQ45905.1 glycosyltransferase [Phycisphaerae bacterium]